MTRTQIQFPDPLYRRLKSIAEKNDWSLAELVRRATELYASRFPEDGNDGESWSFPVLDLGSDYLVDPADVNAEAEIVAERAK